MGMASAQAWILFILVFVSTLVAIGVVGRYTYFEAREGLIDLTETDEKGVFKHTIVKSLDPYKYHVDIARYFL